ncbi:MAG: hypothetical protein GX620_00975 [Chloroflexi bacterium]|nr:hypothetical protein [Chloroflexota bacterium]
MGILKKLSSLFSGAGGVREANVHREYVRCARCGEAIAIRVDLANELTPTYADEGEGEGAYQARKVALGSGKTRCFQSVEVDLYFDAQRRFVSRYITGGDFITREEYEVEQESAGDV